MKRTQQERPASTAGAVHPAGAAQPAGAAGAAQPAGAAGAAQPAGAAGAAQPAGAAGPGQPARPGGQVWIRQAGSTDHRALRDFLTGLSLRTRYLRFFSGAPSASPAMLRALAGGRPGADALVATQGGAIIGHAMAVDTAGPGGAATAEIGVVVADAWQGRGVGSGLVRALAARAGARGATTLIMEVMAENRRVLAMIASRWPGACHDRSAAYVTIHARLAPGRPGGKERPAEGSPAQEGPGVPAAVAAAAGPASGG